MINNASLLLMISVIYEITYFIPKKRSRFRPYISGVLIALICIAIMSMPFTIQPGIIYDTRSILISVTGLIFGFVPTVITVLGAAIFRLSLGGAGVSPGLATIAASAVIGLVWRRWVYPVSGRNKWISVYVMGEIGRAHV